MLDILDCPHIPIIDLIVINRLCDYKAGFSDHFLQDILDNVFSNVFLQDLIGYFLIQGLEQVMFFDPLVNDK